MNYGELKAKIKDQSHRKDLDARIPSFVDDARNRLNYRLTLELVPLSADTDTDAILTDNPLLYFYAAMQALYEFIFEYETASYFNGRFIEQCDMHYVTAPGTEPIAITPEEPTP